MAPPVLTLLDAPANGYTTGSRTLAGIEHPGGPLLVAAFTSYERDVFSGVTWNGAALTKLDDVSHGSQPNLRCELWYKLDAEAGTHDIVCSFGSSEDFGTVVALHADGLTAFGTVQKSAPAVNVDPGVTLAGDANSLMLAIVACKRNEESVLANVFITTNGSNLFTPTGSGSANIHAEKGVVFTRPGDTSVAMTADVEGDTQDVLYRVMLGVPLLGSAGGGSTGLAFDTQPSNVAAGQYIAPSIVVSKRIDGVVDSGFVGDVTLAITTGDGTPYGVLTKTAVAGVATFDEVLVGDTAGGAHKFTASATGEDPVESATFTVSVGSGTTLVLGGGAMFGGTIKRNQETASLRRVHLSILATDGTAWAGSVTGVKAKLSVNGAAESDSPADIVRVAGKKHYVELAQPYTDIAPGSKITARVEADTGRLESEPVTVEIIPGDSYDPPATEDGIAKKTYKALNGITSGYSATKVPGENKIVHTIPDEAEAEVAAVFDASSPGVTSIGVAS